MKGWGEGLRDKRTEGWKDKGQMNRGVVGQRGGEVEDPGKEGLWKGEGETGGHKTERHKNRRMEKQGQEDAMVMLGQKEDVRGCGQLENDGRI